jgi:ribonuclease P protein component
VPKVLGKAHERNRIKRRLRECIRRNAGVLTYPVDVILHPRRTTMELDALVLDREVAQIFRTIQASLGKAAKASVPVR